MNTPYRQSADLGAGHIDYAFVATLGVAVVAALVLFTSFAWLGP